MEKLKNNKFIISTLILIFGGAITKILGMIIKIITTRLIGTETLGIYMLLSPTFSLLIAISQLGFQFSISTLVAEEKSNNKKLILGLIPISLMINLFIMIFIIILSPFISSVLLKNNCLQLGIIGISFVLPFISISSIIRGYFFGKERMIPHVLTNIIEDILRIIILIIGIPYFLKKDVSSLIFFLIVSNIISELSSIIILICFLPKRKLSIKDFKSQKNYLKSIFDISIPSTSSRIIGNIGSFLEPIIITNILLKIGYSNTFIVLEYGIINGYVIPLLLMPSFFSNAISQSLIPVISKSVSKKKYKYALGKLKQAIIFSLSIGIPITILIMLFPSQILNFIYNTNEGVNYLRFLSPIFILLYIQSPLTSTMQSIGEAKKAMQGTIVGVILRTSILFLLSFFKIGLWPLVISISVSIIYVTIHHIINLKRFFDINKSKMNIVN